MLLRVLHESARVEAVQDPPREKRYAPGSFDPRTVRFGFARQPSLQVSMKLSSVARGLERVRGGEPRRGLGSRPTGCQQRTERCGQQGLTNQSPHSDS